MTANPSAPMQAKIAIAERIILTLWVGGLWMIGYLAVPLLFHQLDDTRLAGQLAGEMFRALNWFGLAAGALLLISNRMQARPGLDWRALTLVLMLALILVNAFAISPLMQELKAGGLVAGSEAAARFGRLHGLSSFLYLIQSLLGLGLVVFGIRRG
ncbi:MULTISPECIES: DUF4149 domain-containing protein [Thiohalobacter]|uniref:TMEM205-like domain-containing protein n=1 Tax=Thiohalobacter thiocyanaticus TaxID=585455 RepID=A0A1Z4VR29_9GAMM|nr:MULTISPECIES: DUF4149 domain-containing protein [Thiohalobacter]BAZ94087.1 uncharacterized protein FOKN1_1699 [Thiohalobacter thiocyanaticus]